MWESLRHARIPLRVAAVVALAYLGYVYLARHTGGTRKHEPEKDGKFAATYAGSAVRILQFYARDGEITDDQSTLICYGVENARSVAIDPPVADVYPALNRCVEVAPQHDTEYTLTAAGNDGKTVTAGFTLEVRPDLANRPRITAFEVVKHSVEQGRHYFTIGFAFANANTVTIDPPVFKPLEDSAPFGQWIVTPEQTTTYTLTVMDKKGRKATRKLTVEVPKS